MSEAMPDVVIEHSMKVQLREIERMKTIAKRHYDATIRELDRLIENINEDLEKLRHDR